MSIGEETSTRNSRRRDMIQYTLKIHHGYRYQGEDFFFSIEKEIEMPVFPREGETIFIGELNGEGDYCTISTVWHHPNEKQVIAEVQLHCDEVWLAVEAWIKMPGNWRIIANERVRQKFLYFIEHPDELIN